MNDKLKESLKLLPELPGCYIYYNADNEIIYVGKAKILKRRVKSYFNRKHHDSVKVNILVSQIDHLEYIITNTEVEALILENHLIKKHKPKYNILLKDDKKYPYFLITDEEFPRITIVRKRNLNPEKGRYYGPYTDIRAMYSTLDFLKKIFPLRQCKSQKYKSRPCLYYSIGKCLAPCQHLVTSEEYKNIVKQAELFLSGKQSELMKQLMEQIQKYSDAQQYEKAAEVRDKVLELKKRLDLFDRHRCPSRCQYASSLALPNKNQSAALAKRSFRRAGPLDEHGIAEGEETIAPFHRLAVRPKSKRTSRESADEHDERRFRKMKICHHGIDNLEMIARIDEDARLSRRAVDFAVRHRRRFQRADGGRSHGHDAFPRRLGIADQLGRFVADGINLAMHDMLLDVFRLDGAESAEPDMERQKAEANPRRAKLLHLRLREMQARGRRGRRAKRAAVNGLIPLAIREFFMDIRRKRRFSQSIEHFLKDALV